MGFWSNVRRIFALQREDMYANVGDIAILKMDSVHLRARPTLQPSVEAAVASAPPIDLDQLETYPEGTFGHAVAAFMRAEGIAPFSFSDGIDQAMRDRNAYGIRVAQTHDLIHVLTGFDTTWPGEMGVYAVQYAQRWSASSPILALATWLVYPVLTGLQVGSLLRAWRRGVRLGSQAPFLLAEPLESHFQEPLDAVQRRYGLDDPTAAR